MQGTAPINTEALLEQSKKQFAGAPPSAPVAHRTAPPKPAAVASASSSSSTKPAVPAGEGKHAGGPGAQPRRREPKNRKGDSDIVERLKAICTDSDPTKLYRSLVKIGQG